MRVREREREREREIWVYVAVRCILLQQHNLLLPQARLGLSHTLKCFLITGEVGGVDVEDL